MALLEEVERARIAGLIINKFRGDAALLRPGLVQLEQLTGKQVLGVVPYLPVDIDDEDSLAPRLSARQTEKALDVVVVRLPHLSNFTDFTPLESHSLLGVRYVADIRALGLPDFVLLPGTKNTMDDLLWLRQSGMEAALLRLHGAGVPILGVCGGYQMLGETVDDPEGTESGRSRSLRGLGLLPVRTVFTGEKTRTRPAAVALAEPFAGARLEGYEIHMGRTESRGAPFCTLEDGRKDGCCRGLVWGTYLHGLFDTGALTERLVQFLCARRGIPATAPPTISHRAYEERQFDALADGVRAALDVDAIYQSMGV